MTFTKPEQCREAVVNYAVGYEKGIYFSINEKTRIQAKCAKNCPWGYGLVMC